MSRSLRFIRIHIFIWTGRHHRNSVSGHCGECGPRASAFRSARLLHIRNDSSVPQSGTAKITPELQNPGIFFFFFFVWVICTGTCRARSTVYQKLCTSVSLWKWGSIVFIVWSVDLFLVKDKVPGRNLISVQNFEIGTVPIHSCMVLLTSNKWRQVQITGAIFIRIDRRVDTSLHK